MRQVTLFLALTLLGCADAPAADEQADETLASPSATPTILDQTGGFCTTAQAEQIYGNTKTCAREVCESTNDPGACEIARQFATQHAPAVDYPYTAAHETTSTESLIHEIENYDCEGLHEEVCATRIANREMELSERGICPLKSGGGWGVCDEEQR